VTDLVGVPFNATFRIGFCTNRLHLHWLHVASRNSVGSALADAVGVSPRAISRTAASQSALKDSPMLVRTMIRGP
jgi:hypothetical protein